MDEYIVVLLGDSRVGKTSFVNRLVNGNFEENFQETFGADFNIFESYLGYKR